MAIASIVCWFFTAMYFVICTLNTALVFMGNNKNPKQYDQIWKWSFALFLVFALSPFMLYWTDGTMFIYITFIMTIWMSISYMFQLIKRDTFVKRFAGPHLAISWFLLIILGVIHWYVSTLFKLQYEHIVEDTVTYSQFIGPDQGTKWVSVDAGKFNPPVRYETQEFINEHAAST